MSYPALANEPELLSRLAKSDEQAFTAIYRHYPPIVRKFLLTNTSLNEDDAEDIVQNVFERVWTLRETLSEVASFKGYVITLSSNQFLNSERHRKVRISVHGHLSFQHPVDYDSIENNLLYSFYTKSARKAIDRLPKLERKVFDLTTVYDLTQTEIAKKLRLSRITVRKYERNAKYLIINHLRQHADFMSALFPIIFIIIEKYLSKNFPI